MQTNFLQVLMLHGYKIKTHFTVNNVLQLTFKDGPVADFLEELGALLEGHLAQVDAVSRIRSYEKNVKWK